MKLSFFIDVAMVILISFCLLKKNHNRFENLFMLMAAEFVLLCYYAILYINLDLWTISKGTERFIIFRIYEVFFIPLLFLLYFNLLPLLKKLFSQFGLTVLFIGIILAVELWMVEWKVIMYKNWHAWQSLITSLFLIILLRALLKGYQLLGEKFR